MSSEELYESARLDELVAEKILGWKRFEGRDVPKSITATTLKSGMPHYQRVWGKQVEGKWLRMACEECGDFPALSTSLDQAMMVIEEMEERGMRCLIGIWKGGAKAEFYPANLDEAVAVEAETPAKAVCLAALAMMEKLTALGAY